MEKEQVKKIFFKAVKELPDIDPALRDALRICERPYIKTNQSENIERFLDNLTREITHAQNVRKFKRGSVPYSHRLIKETIFDMVKIFCNGLEVRAKRLHESDLAKSLREKKAQEVKDMEETLNGRPSGAYEEMGLTTDDSRDRNTGQGNQACAVVRNKAQQKES